VFDACTTRIERLAILEATVSGDLQGYGRWLFAKETDAAVVRYEWYVDTTKRWMNFLAPIARYGFRKNHDWLMAHGAKGLARKLNVRLIRVTHTEARNEEILPASHKLRDRPAYDR
jgi:hypothetical protein